MKNPFLGRSMLRFPPTLVLIISALALVACGSTDEPSAHESSASNVRIVRTSPVTEAERLPALTFSGVTRAADRAELAFQVDGRLQSRLSIGEAFGEGDVLATVQNPQLEPNVNASRENLSQIQEQLAQAQRDTSRLEQLVKKKVIGAEALEKARSVEAALVAAERSTTAQLERALQLLAEAELKAPFAGSVAQVQAEPGEYITPGRTVLSIASNNRLEIEIGLPEALVANRTTGESLEVRLPFLGKSLQGKLIQVANAAPGRGRLFPLVISIPAQGLRAGLTAEVDIPRTTPPSLRVPLRAIVDPGTGEPIIFVLEEAGTGYVARQISITVEDIAGEYALVNSSAPDTLKTGQPIIISALSTLIDGEAVQPL